jgi:hypothetical protein
VNISYAVALGDVSKSASTERPLRHARRLGKREKEKRPSKLARELAREQDLTNIEQRDLMRFSFPVEVWRERRMD